MKVVRLPAPKLMIPEYPLSKDLSRNNVDHDMARFKIRGQGPRKQRDREQ